MDLEKQKMKYSDFNMENLPEKLKKKDLFSLGLINVNDYLEREKIRKINVKRFIVEFFGEGEEL